MQRIGSVRHPIPSSCPELSLSEIDSWLRLFVRPASVGSRRTRGGLLISVVLGLLLLMSLLAGTYGYFRQGADAREVSRITQKAQVASAEARMMWKHTLSASSGGWAAELANIATIAPHNFNGMQIHVDPTDSNIFELRFSNVDAGTCRRLRDRAGILGPGLHNVRCRNFDRVFIAYRFVH